MFGSETTHLMYCMYSKPQFTFKLLLSTFRAQVKDISLSERNNQGASDLLAVSSSFTITESVAAVGESYFSKIH